MNLDSEISEDEYLNIDEMSNDQLASWLTSSGSKQQELFKQARMVRHQHWGDELKLRGVIEISNFCQKKCDYCAMRSSNRSLNRFRLDLETIIRTAESIAETGIGIVFLQGGQDPQIDKILEEAIPIISDDLGLDVLLNVGQRSRENYQRFADLGATSFILKYETSDPELYRCIVHEPLNTRIQCMNWIKEVGMKIGTGNIIGLPDQSTDSLVSDIRLSLNFKPDFVSTAPFIHNKGTPLQNHPLGDINLTLNTIAILRIGLKDVFIPAVSALEYINDDGQLNGLNAGANVMTINFTPQAYQENYNIYNNDRFIVSLSHAINTAKKAGLKVNSSLDKTLRDKFNINQ